MNKDSNKEQESSEGSIASSIVSFIVIFSIIFGVKYFKARMFPSEGAKAWQEIADYKVKNRHKETKIDLISEDAITTKESGEIEKSFRKIINIQTEWHNKYIDKQMKCISALDSLTINKIKNTAEMYKCAEISRSMALEIKNHFLPAMEIIEKIEKLTKKNVKSEFKKSISLGYTHAISLYNVFRVLALGNYTIGETVQFTVQKDLDDFSKNFQLFLKITKEGEKREERSIAAMKEASKDQVKMTPADAAASALFMLLRKRR